MAQPGQDTCGNHGGRKRHTDEPCGQPVEGANGRCRLHGGRAPSGIANGNFKHGRHSRHLPARLAERYEAARTDPELLRLSDEVALVDTRIAELLDRIDTAESGPAWTSLTSAWSKLSAAQSVNNAAGLAKAIVEVGEAIERGAGEQATWAELGVCIDRRQRLVESERKRAVEAAQVLTAIEAGVFIRQLAEVIREHVKDRTALSAISRELARLWAAGAAEATRGGPASETELPRVAPGDEPEG